MALKRQTFNNGTQGTTITAANSAGSGDSLSQIVQAGTGAGIYDSSSSLRGAMGAHVTGVLNDTFTMVLSNTSDTSGTAQVYFRIVSYPSVAGTFFRIRSSAGTVCQFALGTTGVLILQNSAGATLKNFDSSTSLSLNTIYRLQLQGTPNASTTAGFIAGQLYADSDTLIDSYTASNVNAGTTLNVQTVQVGKVVTGSNGFDMRFDELAFNTGVTSEIPPVLNSSALKRQTFNSGTQGTAITAGNSSTSGDSLDAVTSVGTGAGIYAAGAAMRGAKGASISGVLNDTFVLQLSNTLSSSAAAQLYFRMPSYPVVGGAFFRIRSTTGNVAILRIEDGGVLLLQDSTGTGIKSFDSSTPLALNTTYRIDLQAAAGTTTTNGYIAAQLYDNGDNLIDSYVANNVNAGTNTSLQYAQAGKVVSGSDGFLMYLDEFALITGTTTPISPVAGGGSTTIKRQTFNNGSQGATITTANSATSGDALQAIVQAGAGAGVYTAIAAIRGTRGAAITGGLNDTFGMTLQHIAAPDITAQVYFVLRSNPTVAGQFFRVRSTIGNAATVSITSTGVLQLQNSVGTTLKSFNSSTPLTLNSKYYFNLQVTTGTTTTNGYIAGQLYDDGDSLVDSYSASNVNSGTDTSLQYAAAGKVVSGSDGFDMYIDELAVDSDSITPIPPITADGNVAPTVNAGVNQTDVRGYSTVTLAATASDLDGTSPTVSWSQISGSPTVTLSGGGYSRTFTAPTVRAGTTLTFRATASDGVLTATDDVSIDVIEHSEWAVMGGVEVGMGIDSVSS